MSSVVAVSKVFRCRQIRPIHFRSRVLAERLQQNSKTLLQKQFRLESTATSPSQPVKAPDYLSEAELKIFTKLKSALEPIKLEVQDVSGGCGSMYGLDIVSPKFEGLSVIKQHQLVNKILADEIKQWHGMQLKTKAP